MRLSLTPLKFIRSRFCHRIVDKFSKGSLIDYAELLQAEIRIVRASDRGSEEVNHTAGSKRSKAQANGSIEVFSIVAFREMSSNSSQRNAGSMKSAVPTPRDMGSDHEE